MKRISFVWVVGAIFAVTFLGFLGGAVSQTVIMQRPLSSIGLSPGFGYGTTTPTVANSGSGGSDGEMFVTLATSTSDPLVQIYSDASSGWLTVPLQGTTATAGLAGDVVIGATDADDFTVKGPRTYDVRREDFDHVGAAQAFEEDFTAAVVTDGGENILLLPVSQLGVIAYRLEAPDGPGLAATPAPFGVDGVLTLDGYTDDVADEGVELVFGSTGPDHLGAYFDEDTGDSMYCEADIDLVDISDLDDLWFGWIVLEAYDNPPASATFNTSALFVLSDNAGDLDIETQLNGGGVLNDDTGTTWADLANHVLRVTLLADSVTFTLNGTAVTQTNAVLNLDATDRAVCVFGYTIAAAGDPQATIDYVEIGVSQ